MGMQGPAEEVLIREGSLRGEAGSSPSDWSHAVPSSFNIRGKDYLVSKQKEASAEAAIYR